MIRAHNLQTLLGGTAYSMSGDKIGKIGQVFLDDETGEPEWVTISTGMFGSKETFVPLRDAQTDGNELRLPYDKDQVTGAPRVDADQHLSASEEEELYRYYGLSDTYSTWQTSRAGVTGTTGTTVGHDTSGPTTDSAMTRSEERMRVGTERVQSGRAKLRKYVTTENVAHTVPVTQETVRVEREPITDANIGKATDGPEISEEEHEVVLHAERPVVAKEAVPVERVRLDTEAVTDREAVSGEVRKEHIDVDAPNARRTER
jgi:uncharacterized protein (TIGR02271 family)